MVQLQCRLPAGTLLCVAWLLSVLGVWAVEELSVILLWKMLFIQTYTPLQVYSLAWVLAGWVSPAGSLSLACVGWQGSGLGEPGGTCVAWGMHPHGPLHDVRAAPNPGEDMIGACADEGMPKQYRLLVWGWLPRARC